MNKLENIEMLQFDLNALKENRVKVLTRKRLIKLVEQTLFQKKNALQTGCLTLDDLEKELIEVSKLQDFASSAGDAEGYARLCGQFVLLDRLIEKARRTALPREQWEKESEWLKGKK